MFGKKSDAYAPPAQLPGRNDPCHCKSGKKYKKCHEEKDAAVTHDHLEKKWQEGEKAAAAKAEQEKAEAAKAPPSGTSHKPPQGAQPSGQKHTQITVPKFNMSRRTGGG